MRRPMMIVHRWVGLVVGLLIAVLGVSGSALVFRGDFERFESRELREVVPAGQRLALDEVVAAALAARPDKRITRVMFTDDPAEAVEVVVQTPGARNLKEAELVSVFVDPYRGTVLGQRPQVSGWIWFMQELHYSLFAAEPGLQVVGVAGIALALLAITGLVVWWPGFRHLRDAFRFRGKPTSLRGLRSLHTIGGAPTLAFLAFIALTGAYYAYRPAITQAVERATGFTPLRPPSIDAASGVTNASLESLVASVQRAVPQAMLFELRPATRPGSVATFRYSEPDDIVRGRQRAFVHPVTAEVLRIDRHEDLPLSQRILANMTPWHFGTFGGRVTQWLWVAIGLLPLGFFVTGGLLWWRKRAARAVSA